MNIPVDIHTHRLPQVPGTAIANCYPETFSPQSGGWYSVGIHPWRIGRSGGEHSGVEGAVASRVCGLEELVRHPQVLAVGEAGLDKLADAPMDLQVEVFRCQACLAEEVGKPLVIHLVKAVDELLKVKRDLRPSNPWIIQGFRGKAALAAEKQRGVTKRFCTLVIEAGDQEPARVEREAFVEVGVRPAHSDGR